jgi:hypothetical protein
METSLHRQLKALYASENAPQTEVKLGAYRIDAIRADETLVEIQHGSLAAIRDKIAALLKQKHRVLVVKPIVATKTIVKLDERGGKPVSRRLSPKRGTILDLFHELIYFTRVFPHERLILEVPLVAVEELRYPGHGRRRRWRKNDHTVEDQRLVEILSSQTFATRTDLWQLLPATIPSPFHTGDLAEHTGVARWIAQRIAYCLAKTGTTAEVGKHGNARLYVAQATALPAKPKRARRSRA